MSAAAPNRNIAVVSNEFAFLECRGDLSRHASCGDRADERAERESGRESDRRPAPTPLSLGLLGEGCVFAGHHASPARAALRPGPARYSSARGRGGATAAAAAPAPGPRRAGWTCGLAPSVSRRRVELRLPASLVDAVNAMIRRAFATEARSRGAICVRGGRLSGRPRGGRPAPESPRSGGSAQPRDPTDASHIMILTQCAACAKPLAYDAPRRVPASVR